MGILDEVNRMKVVPGSSPSSNLTNKNIRYMEVNTLSAPSASESRIQVWSGSSLDLVCLPAPWCVCSIFLCLHVYTSDPNFRELDQLPDEHLIQVQSSYKHLIHVFSIIHHKFRFPEFQNAAAFKEIQDGEQRSSSPEWH